MRLGVVHETASVRRSALYLLSRRDPSAYHSPLPLRVCFVPNVRFRQAVSVARSPGAPPEKAFKEPRFKVLSRHAQTTPTRSRSRAPR
jgi:hypothetical protein